MFFENFRMIGNIYVMPVTKELLRDKYILWLNVICWFWVSIWFWLILHQYTPRNKKNVEWVMEDGNEWEHYPKEYMCWFLELMKTFEISSNQVSKCQGWIKSEISITKWIVTQPKFVSQRMLMMALTKMNWRLVEIQNFFHKLFLIQKFLYTIWEGNPIFFFTLKGK